MSISKILVAATGTEDGLGAVETALLVAGRFDAHVEVVNVRRNPRDAVAFMTEGMTGAVIEEIVSTAEQDIEQRADFASTALKDLAKRHGIVISTRAPRHGHSITFLQQEGREDEVIAERGRLSDLVIAPRPTSHGDAKEEVVAESVLMESGSGLLLVPPGHVSDLKGNAAIAWNGSAEAARAVHRAMPLLTEAEEVTIMAPEESSMRGPGPDALTEYLAHHDIRCHVHNLPTNWTNIGHTLLDIARSEDARFVVMGAFSQGKLRQLILGGATRFILNHADLPVLFTH